MSGREQIGAEAAATWKRAQERARDTAAMLKMLARPGEAIVWRAALSRMRLSYDAVGHWCDAGDRDAYDLLCNLGGNWSANLPTV